MIFSCLLNLLGNETPKLLKPTNAKVRCTYFCGAPCRLTESQLLGLGTLSAHDIFLWEALSLIPFQDQHTNLRSSMLNVPSHKFSHGVRKPHIT